MSKKHRTRNGRWSKREWSKPSVNVLGVNERKSAKREREWDRTTDHQQSAKSAIAKKNALPLMNDSNKVESFCCTLIFVDTFAAVWIARSLHISLSLFLHLCDCVWISSHFASRKYSQTQIHQTLNLCVQLKKSRKTGRQKEKQTPRKRAYWIHRFSESSILSVHIHLLSTGGLLCLDIRALHSYSSLSHILLCSLPSSVA